MHGILSLALLILASVAVRASDQDKDVVAILSARCPIQEDLNARITCLSDEARSLFRQHEELENLSRELSARIALLDEQIRDDQERRERRKRLDEDNAYALLIMICVYAFGSFFNWLHRRMWTAEELNAFRKRVEEMARAALLPKKDEQEHRPEKAGSGPEMVEARSGRWKST